MWFVGYWSLCVGVDCCGSLSFVVCWLLDGCWMVVGGCAWLILFGISCFLLCVVCCFVFVSFHLPVVV